jgi:hypothetical protein
MKRAAVFVVLLAVWLAPEVKAQRSFKCLLVNEKDPKACAPPPCEVIAELNVAKATRSAVSRMLSSPKSDRNALRQVQNDVIEGRRVAYGKYSKCTLHPRASAFFPNPGSCDLEEDTGPTRSRGTCSEFVEAEQEAGKWREAECRRYKVLGQNPYTGARTLLTERVASTRRVDVLRANLLGYLASCAPDADLSRQLSAAGLDGLKKVGKILRENWLSKRASAAAGR